MPFAEILGHDHVKAVLARLIERQRLPGALLLCGPAGVGKKRLALAVARALVCEQPRAAEACGRCGSCLRSAKGIHPDVSLLEPATPTAIKIDQVRDVVRDILSRPFEGRARAFIIDDAHLMTEEASNALLKALEEPPATSHVFLVTGSPQALLPTIRSRCQTLRVGALPSASIETYLREQAGLDAVDAQMRASLSGGSLGQALAFEADAYRGVRDGVLGLLESLPGSDALRRLESAEWLDEQERHDLALVALRSLLRDVAALASGAPSAALLNADVATRLAALAQGSLGLRALALSDSALEAETLLRGNANKLLTMDVLVDAIAG
jgi:DNA polymerase-3 subunit delta'